MHCLSVLPGEKKNTPKIPGESSSKAIHDPTVPTPVGQMHHVDALRRLKEPGFHTEWILLINQCELH